MKASFHGAVIAESDATIDVEGVAYFPPDSLRREYFRESDTHTTCNWKGEASYYTVVVDGEENADAAWYYPDALEKAAHFQGYVAFWKGVVIE